MTTGGSTSKIKADGTVEGAHQLDRLCVRIGYYYMVIRNVKSIINDLLIEIIDKFV
jgi:hypothetical protein